MKRIFFLAVLGMFGLACRKSNNISPNNNNNNTPTIPSSVLIDGNSYPVVKIGSQLWTSVNYNGTGGVNYNDSANIANYGKLYSYDEAKAVVLPNGWRLPTATDFETLMKAVGTTSSNSDYLLIADTGGSKKLRSVNGWVLSNGTNKSGFNALPAGKYYDFNIAGDSNYTGKGYSAGFWSATASPDDIINNQHFKGQYILGMLNYTYSASYQFIPADITVIGTSYSSSNYKFSLRFVKDY